MRYYILASSIFGLLSILACQKDNNTPTTTLQYTKSNTIAYNAISGVNANLLSLDIYHFDQPAQLKPVIVYFHGGAWVTGDKANQLENKKKLFASLGYLLISVNYRLSPNDNNLDPNRVKYPIHNNDGADAIKWIYDNVATYGGNKNKMVLLGHSAGAHLVSLTGTSNLFLPKRNIMLNTIKGIASIDTEGYDVYEQANANEAVYINAFGTNPTIWNEASPIKNVTSSVAYPRFFIAKRGTAARIAIADAFINKLQSNGVLVSQVNGSQYNHEGINDAIGAANETVITEPLKNFLAQCFQ